jgi:hypothetical protein
MSTSIITSIPVKHKMEQESADMMQYVHQISMLSMQLFQLKSKEQPWDLLEASVKNNPCLQTAWTDFLMVLKLADPEASTRLDTLIGNWAI